MEKVLIVDSAVSLSGDLMIQLAKTYLKLAFMKSEQLKNRKNFKYCRKELARRTYLINACFSVNNLGGKDWIPLLQNVIFAVKLNCGCVCISTVLRTIYLSLFINLIVQNMKAS